MEPILYTDLPKYFGPDVALLLSPDCFARWCGLEIGPSLLIPSLLISDVTSHFHTVKSEWPLYFYCQLRKNTAGETAAIVDLDSTKFELPALLSKNGALKLRATLSLGGERLGLFLECFGTEVGTPLLLEPIDVNNWSVFQQRVSLGAYEVLSFVEPKVGRDFYLQIYPSDPPKPRKINRFLRWI